MGIVGFIVGVILCLIPAAIANKKGRNFFRWWFYAILLPPIALIHVLSLRPQEETIQSEWKQCKICKESYPSKSNFKIEGICHGCWRKLSKEQKQNPQELLSELEEKEKKLTGTEETDG